MFHISNVILLKVHFLIGQNKKSNLILKKSILTRWRNVNSYIFFCSYNLIMGLCRVERKMYLPPITKISWKRFKRKKLNRIL